MVWVEPDALAGIRAVIRHRQSRLVLEHRGLTYLDQGDATMRANNALSADEVEEGWVLTCQAVPTSREVVVDYER